MREETRTSSSACTGLPASFMQFMKTLILQGSVWSKLSGPPAAIELVRGALTIVQPKAQFTRSYQYGTWDGTIKFLRRPYNTFMTGLTARVVSILQLHGYTTEVLHGELPAPQPQLMPQLRGLVLRDYQARAAEWAVKHYRVSIQSPTASGKTEIGAEIIRRCGLPTLWLTHRRVLMHQTAERLGQRLDPQFINKTDEIDVLDSGRLVLVAMVQTLARWPAKMPFWKHWGMIIVDECQHASNDTWADIAMRCVGARYRIGLSGTVITGDPVKDMKLEGITGPLYTAAETQELADRGFLATPLIKFVHPDPASFPTYAQVRERVYPKWRINPRGLRKLGGKLYQQMYLEGIVNNPHHLAAIVSVVKKHSSEKIFILFRDIEHKHGEYICSAVEKLPPYYVYYASGSTSDVSRETMLSAFRKDKHGVVFVASTIFDQGVDIPEIDVLILAGGGQSQINTLQRVGRALRPRPDKNTVLIYDIWAGQRPGHKDYLANHSATREQDYLRQGFSVEHVRL